MRVEVPRSLNAWIGVLGRPLLIVAVLFASLFAYWSWLLMLRPVPLPLTHIEGRPDKLAKQIQGRRLFGSAGGLVGSLPAVMDAGQMVLAGIVSTGSATRGVAIIFIEGKKAVTARVGQEIVPDVILSRVAHDHVELTRRGQTINLRLVAKK
jgi:hypothetical protein